MYKIVISIPVDSGLAQELGLGGFPWHFEEFPGVKYQTGKDMEFGTDVVYARIKSESWERCQEIFHQFSTECSQATEHAIEENIEKEYFVAQAAHYCQMTEEQASELYDTNRWELQKMLHDAKRKWAKTLRGETDAQ